MQTSFSDVVILAGGFGERLWPASTPEFPKQFMALSDGISFMQKSILRALSVISDGKIFIISRPEICNELTKQVDSLKATLSQEQKTKIENDLYVIAEPSSRHTCPPLLLTCKLLKLMDSKEHTILVLTSDHVISPMENFISDCKKAASFAQQGKFVCFAIPPYEPSTGFGYINMGEPLDSENSVLKIDSFKEKPNFETAKKYLESGKYAWNSGMFGFTDSLFISEIKQYENEMFNLFEKFNNAQLPNIQLLNSTKYIENWEPLNEAYKTVKSIAVDNAIAERTKNAVAVKASFNWDDVGSWDSFEKYFDTLDEKTISVESSNNFVYSDLPIALCGVEDLIVVVKNEKVFITKKGSSNLMRKVVQQFKQKNN